MARWRLSDAHYLNVPGTEWMYEETDRETGKKARKIFEIPLYLNPDDAADQNYPGEIIVSHRYSAEYRRDIVFVGPPTPDMEPIDDEAREISQGYIDRGEWKHPIDALNMTYSQSVLSELEQAIVRAATANIQVQLPNASTGGVTKKQFDDLQATVRQLMEQNASLQAQVLDKKSVRRI